MRLPRIAALCALSAALSAALSGDVWRPPQPVPRECVAPQFEAVLVDVSGSMKHGGLFDQQKKNIEDYLKNTAPACSLVIIGSFGVTADVHEAQFLISASERERLVASVGRLRPTQPSTNLDEAAKLVELLSYQLRSAYGSRANRLIVRVYSDFESSPSIGKPRFSLAEYLARRMNGRYMRDSADDGTAEEVVQVMATPALEFKPAPTPPKPAWGKGVKLAAIIAGCVLIIALCSMVWVQSRSRYRGDHGAGPAALLVTECVARGGESASEMVGPERRVDVATGVPIVFSTDSNYATYVASLVPTADNGELFRLEPLPDGCVRIQSPHTRVTINDQPLGADRRLKFDIHEPIRIRLGSREFNIIGVFGRPQMSERADNVFDAEPLQH